MAASCEAFWPGQLRSLTSIDDVRQHVSPYGDGITWTPYDATCCAPFPHTEGQMWVSTPNAWFIPSPPYQPKGQRFGYFNDGMLGWHEHNKWPQRLYQPEQYSLAAPCNPRLAKLHQDAVHGPYALDQSHIPFAFADPGIAWIHLVKSRDFYRTTQGFSPTEGLIDRHLLDNMENATEEAKRLAEQTAQRLAEPQTSDVPVHIRQVEVDTTVYQTSKAMQLNRAYTVLRYHSMEWFDAVLWFREWQRLLLDLRAWILWLDVVRPRQLDPTFMKPFPVLPIRGVITSDPALVYDMFRVGVPVWYIHNISFLTTQTRILAVQNFVDPSIYFSAISTIEEDGVTVPAPRLASGPRLRNMSYQDLRVYVRKFSLSHSPIYGLTDTVDPEIVRPHYNFCIDPVPIFGTSKAVPLSLEQSASSADAEEPSSGVIGEYESEGASGMEEYRLDEADVDELKRYYQPDTEDKLVQTLPETDADLDRVIESLTSTLQRLDVRDEAPRSKGELRKKKVTRPPSWAHQSESLSRLEHFMLENFRDDNGKMQKYHLPPVHLFYASESDSPPVVHKTHNWLRIRQWCFDHLSRVGEQGSTPMTAHEWRAALDGLYYSIPYDSSVVKPKSALADIQRLPSAPPEAKRQRTGPSGNSYKSKKNEKAQYRRLASNIDVNVRFGVLAGFDPYDADQQVSWGKVTLRSADIAAQPGHTLLHEILWELSVANFRLELLELDRAILRVVYDHPDRAVAARRESLVCRVWRNGHLRPTWEDTDQCDVLSSILWADRIPAVKQLAFVLSSWPGGDEYKTWNPATAWNAFAFFEFEYSVFLFYARAFHQRYGRRPILPLLLPKSLARRL
ncbi:hypothetical protein PsYK624_171030 [Phanerochaete sordida]|uniref:Uncharacterized protein n=1 Tax=Phanerochaete sordida TaxID=48140 RepID=A0A9P3GTG6_9APHY|nr:hypothetical protein PsYK624_171030 [Phanerochaete sordida]